MERSFGTVFCLTRIIFKKSQMHLRNTEIQYLSLKKNLIWRNLEFFFVRVFRLIFDLSTWFLESF